MLHEILLFLSGNPSSLFDSDKPDDGVDVAPVSFPLLSPSEVGLLSSIAHLGQLHLDIKKHAPNVASSHPSTICRAVAGAIDSSHLGKFQQNVMDVEARILKRDSSMVGAYNIVPLLSITVELTRWTRRMEWYLELTRFMLPGESANRDAGDCSMACTGAGLIDRLRQDVQTGFSDVKAVAEELSKVAEISWVRQLSAWVLFGRLPTDGAGDFFISQHQDENGVVDYTSTGRLLPKFVSVPTASSILFIGRSLNQIQNSGTSDRSPMASELKLLGEHYRILSALKVPISKSSLSEAISAIRLSLSRNTLQNRLPLPAILRILTLLHEFFLLGRGEFTVALVEESDQCMRSRHQRPQQRTSGRRVQAMLVNREEAAAVLSRTWAKLDALLDDGEVSEPLEQERKLVHLSPSRPASARPLTPGRAEGGVDALPKLSNTVFNDVLFSTSISLELTVSPPLDLFLASAEVDCYSAIHAYLLAVHRAHLRMTDLWRQSSLRRSRPANTGPPRSNASWAAKQARRRGQMANEHSVDMRKVWVKCSTAVFLLSELVSHLGVVVQGSWRHFRRWIGDAGNAESHSSHDLEMLASVHRVFLSALSHELLLTDEAYTRALRSFLTHVDELVALIDRVQTVQNKLELTRNQALEDALANYKQEEEDVLLELERAQKRMDGDRRSLIHRLGELDKERVGTGVFVSGEAIGGFEPWRECGVDRLLMKLDFGIGSNEQSDGKEGLDLL